MWAPGDVQCRRSTTYALPPPRGGDAAEAGSGLADDATGDAARTQTHPVLLLALRPRMHFGLRLAVDLVREHLLEVTRDHHAPARLRLAIELVDLEAGP